MTARFYTRLCVLTVLPSLLGGCASPVAPVAPAPTARHFDFDRDVLAFTNQLLWEYEIDPTTGSETGRARSAPVEFGQRCPLMVSLVRQFYLHARFDPSLPRADAETYAELIEAVRARDLRGPRVDAEPVVIPGYDGLRSLSADYEPLLKRVTGPSWRSYLQRGNWRMIFPFSRAHQARLAERLVEALEGGELPILHLMTFPKVRLNHSVLIYSFEATPTRIRYEAYDPNVATAPRALVYDRALREFEWVETSYFAGGRVDAYEIYRNAFY